MRGGRLGEFVVSPDLSVAHRNGPPSAFPPSLSHPHPGEPQGLAATSVKNEGKVLGR